MVFTESETGLVVEGVLNEANSGEFASRLIHLQIDPHRPLVLDLGRLDIEDELALAVAVTSLRELRRRVSKLVLIGAPQILGHNLYRVGALEGARAIELVDMRLEEPSPP